MRALLLAIVITIAPIAARGDDRIWEHFHPKEVSGYGCTWNRLVSPTGATYRLIVWAEHGKPGEKDWQYTLSIRNNEDDTWKDCREWKEEARKRICLAIGGQPKKDRCAPADKKAVKKD